MPVCPQIEIREVEPGTAEAFWREAIVAWAASGLAQVEFCRLRGLSLKAFCRYRTRLTRPAKSATRKGAKRLAATTISGFVEVPVTMSNRRDSAESRAAEKEDVSAESGTAACLEIRLSNGRRIAVREGFDRETLLALVATLESERC